jgi:hypothetical protein
MIGKIFGVLVSLPILCSCSGVANGGEYEGVYLMKEANSFNKILISSDGKYVHSIESNGTITSKKEGYWDKDESNGDMGITLRSFELHNQPGGGFWFIVPEKNLLGTIRLCIDIDEQICFDKMR